MRPNGRTLYKVLMKGRQSVFWGRRAFLTVRLPASVIPVPRPPIDYCKDWGEDLGNIWVKDLGDGVEEVRHLGEISSGGDPRVDRDEDAAEIHFLTEEKEGVYTLFSWWEGTLTVVRPAESDTEEPTRETSDLSVEAITAHKALRDWNAMYMDGTVGAERGVVLDAFLAASNAAKTHYTAMSEDGQLLYITYSVKWFYKSRARRFCADLKRAFRAAAENNVNAKLIR